MDLNGGKKGATSSTDGGNVGVAEGDPKELHGIHGVCLDLLQLARFLVSVRGSASPTRSMSLGPSLS